MKLLEFLGAPGSGKSTQWAATEKALRSAHLSTATLDEATRRALAMGAAGGVLKGYAKSAGRISTRSLKKLYARSPHRLSIISRAIVENPTLTSVAVRAASEHNRNAGADLVLGMFLSHLGSQRLANIALDPGTWLTVDEGFCNRVTSLFAADDDDGADRADLHEYLGHIPRPDVLVLVETPWEVCRDRLEASKWTLRIRGLPLAKKVEFLKRAQTLCAITAEAMSSRGSQVIRIDGTIDPLGAPPRILEAMSQSS